MTVAVPTNDLANLLARNSPGYRSLDARGQHEVAQALGKIARYLDSPVARQMAPDLRSQIGTQAPSPPTAPGSAPPAPAATGGAPAPAQPSGGGATARAGEVARATLSAIDFPSFVASLIQGTFQAIVDSSIQQMEAYATLLKNVASTVDRFMADNISEGMARDHLADQYGGVFGRDASGGTPKLTIKQQDEDQPLPSFLQDLGFNATSDIDNDAIENVIVPATRRNLAEERQRLLATMVLMGINRVVVDDGEINAKLQFHIDASETMKMRFDQQKTTAGNMSGYAGRSPFSAQSVMVNTASLNAQSDLNVRADLTGQVKVKFRSETFPLERFADSAAIQFISSNARVPQPNVAGAAPAPAPAAPPAAAATPAPAKAPAAAAVELAGADDPWAPET
ncbi:MAG: hypothetical protein U1F41_01080 [Burkholderiales bacterium]